MATRRTNAAMTMDEAAESTQRPGKVAAFLPVDNKGNPVEMNGDENWRMPVGSELMAPHPDDEFEGDPGEQTPVDRITSMLRNVNDGERAYLKVSRVVVGNKVEFCAQYSAADFEAGGLEMIRDQWGPGEYQLILYGTRHLDSGKDHFGIRDRTSVMIAAPLKAAAVAQPQSELATLVQQLTANQQEMMRVLSERAPAPDPMVQMTGMLSMMKLMREAMGIDNVPKPAGGLKDIVDAIKQLREVNEEINPPATPDTPMGMVTKMLPLIQAGLAQRQQQPAAPAAPATALPQLPVLPANTPIQNAAIQQPPQTDMNIIQQKGYLSTLVQMAKAKLPTVEGANFVYENLHDDLIAALGRDDWFELLSGITGDISAEREWFTTVRTEALAMFDEPEGGEATTVPPAP